VRSQTIIQYNVTILSRFCSFGEYSRNYKNSGIGLIMPGKVFCNVKISAEDSVGYHRISQCKP
jgi:hypothetical protein